MNRILQGAILLLASSVAAAQGFPNRPLKLVVPLAAGGGTDLAARVVGAALAERLGQPVVIENRTGAGGVVGVEAVAKAPADGYTFVIGSSTTMAANVFLYKDLPFDPMKDFVPLAMLGGIDFGLTVPASLPANNLREFIAYAKARPGKLSYGFGTSAALLCGELFKSMTGTDIVKVPYKGSPQSLTDLAADRIQMVCEPFGTSMPFVKSGKMKILASTNTMRSTHAPDVPTMTEQGLNMVHVTWAAFFAKAGTPPEALAKLRAELVAVQKQPGIPEKIRDTGFIPQPDDWQSLGATHRADIARLEKLVKETGIKPE